MTGLTVDIPHPTLGWRRVPAADAAHAVDLLLRALPDLRLADADVLDAIGRAEPLVRTVDIGLARRLARLPAERAAARARPGTHTAMAGRPARDFLKGG